MTNPLPTLAQSYKGYTIQQSSYFPNRVEYFQDGVSTRHAYDLQDAKDQIDEKIMIATPSWFVETFGPYPIGGIPHLNITKFSWLEDAVKFASQFNGQLTVHFNCP